MRHVGGLRLHLAGPGEVGAHLVGEHRRIAAARLGIRAFFAEQRRALLRRVFSTAQLWNGQRLQMR